MASGRVRILSGGVRNVKNISEEGTRDAKKGRGTSFSLKRNALQTVTRRRGDKGKADFGFWDIIL